MPINHPDHKGLARRDALARLLAGAATGSGLSRASLLGTLGLASASAAQAQLQPLPPYAVRTVLQSVANSRYHLVSGLSESGEVAGVVVARSGTKLGVGSADIWFGVSIPLPWLTFTKVDRFLPARWTAQGQPVPLPRYSGGYDAVAHDLSSNGIVVGGMATTSAQSSNKLYQACLWRNGTLVDLKVGSTRSQARPSVNNQGWVLSKAESADQHFIWRDGVRENLPRTARTGGEVINALSIDDAGAVLVAERFSGGRYFIYRQGTFTPLNLPSATRVSAVKQARNGVVFGELAQVTAESTRSEFFMVRQGVTHVLSSLDARLLPTGFADRSVTVNDAGWLLFSQSGLNGGADRFWLWNGVSLVDLASLLPQGVALHAVFDMNRKGEVLAQVSLSGQGASAFVVLSPATPLLP